MKISTTNLLKFSRMVVEIGLTNCHSWTFEGNSINTGFMSRDSLLFPLLWVRWISDHNDTAITQACYKYNSVFCWSPGKTIYWAIKFIQCVVIGELAIIFCPYFYLFIIASGSKEITTSWFSPGNLPNWTLMSFNVSPGQPIFSLNIQVYCWIIRVRTCVAIKSLDFNISLRVTHC